MIRTSESRSGKVFDGKGGGEQFGGEAVAKQIAADDTFA